MRKWKTDCPRLVNALKSVEPLTIRAIGLVWIMGNLLIVGSIWVVVQLLNASIVFIGF
jgi:hypothetical protein